MIELNTAGFDSTIASEIPTVVDFWAEWCMPCKMFAPIFEQASDEMDGKANFAKVDVDAEGPIAAKYSISSIPTIVIFKNGEEKERFSGGKSKDDLIKIVLKYV